MSETEQPQLERPRFRKTKSVIAGFIGAAVTAGMTYGGYKMGEQLYNGDVVTLPSAGGLFFGIFAGITTASSVETYLTGRKPILTKTTRSGDASNNSSNQPPTPPQPEAEPIPEPVAEQEAAKPALDQLVQAVNDGTLRKEIDEAVGNDPDLAV